MQSRLKQINKYVFLLLVILLVGCSVYRSADRNRFESDTPELKIKSLAKVSCSDQSLASQAQTTRFITKLPDESKLWQLELYNQTVYESSQSTGTYCLYDVQFEN